jgi:hypothetical protein
MANAGISYRGLGHGADRLRYLGRFGVRTHGNRESFCNWNPDYETGRFGGIDLEVPGGEIPQVASSEEIEEFRTVFGAEIPRALEQLFSTFPSNELAIAFELVALRRENETLREQVATLAREMVALRQKVETLPQAVAPSWPSATELLTLIERDAEEERDLAIIAAKRERYKVGLTADALEAQVQQVIEAEMGNPHHDFDG